ncbi:hypothetical protein E0Z10_g4555 [Xylaria hypoxylon]|uniref:Uncharacterized protein n=1 Tax=Xylaria hypoxylon TaxID=37992 RepID=A0A4Z0YXN1_9PEZI|nr:hypothetical protein E0Z10_g4555 [Xylaria hypoxylon]
MEYTAGWTMHSEITGISPNIVNAREHSNTPGSADGGKSVGFYAGIVAGSGALFILLGAVAIWLFRSERRMKRAPDAETLTEISEISTFHNTTFSLSMLEKLGISGILVISLPLILEIAALGFLSTFWTMPTTQASNDTIRRWIADDRLPAIIAIVSLVIRFSKGLQMALALSMVASIALERYQVRVADIPALMLQRSNGTESTSLLLLFLRNAFAETKSRQSLFLLLLLPLAILSYATEFTSTLLLSDFGSISMQGFSSTQPFPVGFDDLSLQYRRGEGNDHVNYAGTSPSTFPPFAELSDGNTKSGFIDYTGLSLRAFLPISSLSSRQSMRNFTGFVTMINATTLCLRPHVVSFSVALSENNHDLVTIQAKVDYPLLENELRSQNLDAASFFNITFNNDTKINQYSSSEMPGKFTGAFNCTIPASIFVPEIGNLEIPSFLCSLGGVRAFAFVNLTGLNDINNRIPHDDEDDWWKVSHVSDLDVNEKGSWSTLAYKLKQDRVAWSISLCSTVIEPQFQQATIWSEFPLNEELLIISNTSKSLDTTNLLRWSGASIEKASPRERGVQVLGGVEKSLTSSQPTVGSGLLPLSRPLGSNPLGQDFQDGKTTYWLCEYFCPEKYNDGPVYLHPIYSRILRDSLAETVGPARALRAFWTMIYQAYYYDSLPFFNLFNNSTSTSWIPVLAPVQWRGFIVVIVLTTIHLLFVYGILVYFLWCTSYSKLHDPWWAYTQTYRGELANALEEITSSAVKDPVKLLRQQEDSGDLVGLDIDILGQAVGIRKRNRKSTGFDSSNSDSD